MKQMFLCMVSLVLMTSCTSELELPSCDSEPKATRSTKKRIYDDCSVGSDDDLSLSLIQADKGFETSLSCYGESYQPQNGSMVLLQVWGSGLATNKFYSAPYDSVLVDDSDGTTYAYATVTTPNGTVFTVTDQYTPISERKTLRLYREVFIKERSVNDEAFNSYVMLRKAESQSVDENEYYVPSLVFKDGSNMSEVAIGSDWTDDWILAREERMALPMTMMRDKESGVSLSIIDYNLKPTTLSTDWGNSHLKSSSLCYASLGYNLEGDAPALVHCYPGSEGERSYSDGGGYASKVWARRSSPVLKSFKQKITMEFCAKKNENFAEAQRDHWRVAFDLYSPEELDVDSKTILDESLKTLDYYWLKSGNAPGFPFSVFVDNGKVHETSFDMGFVGMQVACGYYLYRYGLDNNNATYRKKGEQILDFWANNSANEVGMPRVWYDIEPWNSWRNSNDLRNMQGGMEAMILAWSCAESAHPGSHPNWLRFCKRAADWMVGQQRADGSFPKAFYNDGSVADAGSYLTSNVVRFLTCMYGVTRKHAYHNAVVKAADWCLKNIHEEYKYIGSVIDNPYVKDRESGQKMLEAMLAAYDLTSDERYLEAAKQAAYYTVSYMYAWNIPWETGTTLTMPWPKKKTTVGITIIATGHSGADCGFSYNSFEYLRLYNLTGDEYFLRIAKLLEKNTKQTMNYDGSLNYPHKGLQREAIRLVTHRGDGVNLWLPWCTASALDPLFHMEDAYGQIGIDNIIGASGQTRAGSAELDDSRYVRKLGMVRIPDGKTY